MFIILYLAAAILAPNFIIRINGISMLNETNFKLQKKAVEIVIDRMDLDLALRVERPTSTPKNSIEAKIEMWDRYNRMCLMIIKCSIPKSF